MAEALYRKYRPQVFEDVVGQEHIERTLKNAIEQDKVSHAYLFCGPRGTGKTTTARLLAKALLCEKGPVPEPDGTCGDCELIAQGEHPDVYELDAASRTGVENVREEIIGRVQFAPTRGRYKIYIIDEVHMLSTPAFNALLKTLEEPPSHVVFILATTDPQRVPETIHSRCQRFDFRRISAEAIVSRLGAICVSEEVEFEGEALDLIAHRAEGGMRNALTSLEQLIAFGAGKVTLAVAERMLGCVDSDDLSEIMQAVGKRDAAACFRWTAQYVETGADLAQFVRDMAAHVRDLYVLSLTQPSQPEWLEVSAAERRQLENELSLFGSDRLSRLLGVLGDLSVELKTATNPRLSFEIALTRMVRPDCDITLEGLAERIEALEKGASFQAVTPLQEVNEVAPIAKAASDDAVLGVRDSLVPGESSRAQGMNQSTEKEAAFGVQKDLQPRQVPLKEAVDESQENAFAQAGMDNFVSGLTQNHTEVSVDKAPVSQTVSPVDGSAEIASKVLDTLRDASGLQRVWRSVLSNLKRQKAAYGALFLTTQAEFDESSQQIYIIFPDESEFAYKAAQKPEVQDAVSAGLLNACGQAIAFSYRRGKLPLEAVASAPASSKSVGSLSEKNAFNASSESKRGLPQAISNANHPESGRSVPNAVSRSMDSEASVENGFSGHDSGRVSEQTLGQKEVSRKEISSDGSYRGSLRPDGERTMPGIPQFPEASVSYDGSEVEQSALVDTPPWEDEMPPYEDEYYSFGEENVSSTGSVSSDSLARKNSSSPMNSSADKLGTDIQLPEERLHEGEETVSSAADMQAILSAGFGEGVVFEQVEE